MSAKFNKTSYTPYIVHQRKSNNNFASSKNTRLFLWVYRNQITHMLFYPLQENKKNTRHEIDNNTNSFKLKLWTISQDAYKYHSKFLCAKCWTVCPFSSSHSDVHLNVFGGYLYWSSSWSSIVLFEKILHLHVQER